MIDDDDDDFDVNRSMDLISSCKEFYIKRVRCLDDFRDKFAYSSSQFTYSPKCPEIKAFSDVSTSKCSIISPQMKPNGDVSTSNRNNNSTLSDGLIQLKTDMVSHFPLLYFYDPKNGSNFQFSSMALPLKHSLDEGLKPRNWI